MSLPLRPWPSTLLQNNMARFRFKQFEVDDGGCAMKVGTDSVLLGSWCECDNMHNVLDLGAGSGLLALMIAQRAPAANIKAVEIDPAACAAAAANFAASPWADRLTAVCADALTGLSGERPDLIICNPPFFIGGMQSPDSRRALARHSGGLSPESAIDLAARILSPTGSLAMVTPAEYADSLLFHAEIQRLNLWRRCDVTTSGTKPSRLLWQWGRMGRPVEMSALSVRHAGVLTPEYTSLTSAFYL